MQWALQCLIERYVLAHRVGGSGEVQLTATLFGSAAPGHCVGDCNGSGAVTIEEIIRGVRIVLEGAAVSDCPAFDPHERGVVDVTAIVQAVNAALAGCPG